MNQARYPIEKVAIDELITSNHIDKLIAAGEELYKNAEHSFDGFAQDPEKKSHPIPLALAIDNGQKYLVAYSDRTGPYFELDKGISVSTATHENLTAQDDAVTRITYTKDMNGNYFRETVSSINNKSLQKHDEHKAQASNGNINRREALVGNKWQLLELTVVRSDNIMFDLNGVHRPANLNRNLSRKGNTITYYENYIFNLNSTDSGEPDQRALVKFTITKEDDRQIITINLGASTPHDPTIYENPEKGIKINHGTGTQKTLDILKNNPEFAFLFNIESTESDRLLSFIENRAKDLEVDCLNPESIFVSQKSLPEPKPALNN